MEKLISFDAKLATAEGRVAIVTVEGELDLHRVPALREVLETVPDDRRWIVVDLEHVTFLDSAGLSLLTTIARDLRARGGGVVLALDDRNVQKVLELTGLGRFFEQRRTVSAAVEHARLLARFGGPRTETEQPHVAPRR